MVLSEVIAPNGYIFLKSEFGPISNDWPAVSFSKRTVGERLRRDFLPERDIILYVGTGSAATTENPAHRRNLLSAVKVEPNAIHETRLLVPAAIWEASRNQYKGRWELSMSVRNAWEIAGFPSASDLIPNSYRSLGTMQALGNIVEVLPEERSVLLNLDLTPLKLTLQEAAVRFDDKRALITLDVVIRQEIARMAAGIRDRVRRGGTESVRMNPPRFVDSDVDLALGSKWREQQGKCALCGGTLAPSSANHLLRPSTDRIDSSVPWYNFRNIQITHQACNLAKNDVPMDHFMEWLMIVRGLKWGMATIRAKMGHLVTARDHALSRRRRTEVLPIPSRLAISDFVSLSLR